MNHYRINLLQIRYKKTYSVLISFLLLFIVILINGQIDMNTRQYSNLLLFGIGGLLGTYVTIELAKKISISENMLIKLLIFLGQNSLIIFLYEIFTPHIFLSFINIFMHLKSLVYSSPILGSLNDLIFSIVTVIIIKKISFLNRIYY
jgi:hypothetical protein